VQHNNAQHAVLFEAIALAIHLDANSPLVSTAATLLAGFISSKETNVRYLGLDTMAHLAARADSLAPIKRHQDTIIISLRDKDISVRRRALDLLYSMCEVDNSELIVGELLRYLRVADYALREEMVLKIAILTEKYASSYKWYVDTIFALIGTAGDHVGDEVWYRVIQIVTNTEDLQEYASKAVFEHLRTPTTHESLVKIGGESPSAVTRIRTKADSAGYILGEYGHLIANEQGYSPLEQFQLLHSKSQFCAAPTRSLLLSTYIKWVNVFPEIRVPLVNVFERYRHVLDVDLQQRACEFYALASRGEDDELLQNVCEEMPPFPPRQSALLGRLNRKTGDSEDKRVWIHGGKEANEANDATKGTQLNGAPATPASDGNDITNALAGLDLSTPTISQETSASIQPPPPAMASAPPPPSAPMPASGPNVDRWFEKLTYSTDGVLYEDGLLQIGIKSRFQGHLGQLAVYMGNKISAPMTSVTTTIHSGDPTALSVTLAKMPPTTIAPRTQAQLQLQVECKKPFFTPPILTISFLAGSHQSVSLRLPVVVTKFLEHVTLEQADFFERWRLIGGPPREAQGIFPIKLTDAGELDLARQEKVVSGIRFNILHGIDPNTNNIVGAGVLHTSIDGKVGCLLRVEPNKDAKVSMTSRLSLIVAHSHFHLPAFPRYRAEHVGDHFCGGAEAAAKSPGIPLLDLSRSATSRFGRCGKWTKVLGSAACYCTHMIPSTLADQNFSMRRKPPSFFFRGSESVREVTSDDFVRASEGSESVELVGCMAMVNGAFGGRKPSGISSVGSDLRVQPPRTSPEIGVNAATFSWGLNSVVDWSVGLNGAPVVSKVVSRVRAGMAATGG
jgi:AP-2 complex subunit alpha